MVIRETDPWLRQRDREPQLGLIHVMSSKDAASETLMGVPDIGGITEVSRDERTTDARGQAKVRVTRTK